MIAPAWYILEGKGLALIPKAGTQSINETGAQPVEAGEVLGLNERIAFIRHPIERLKSAYRFFCKIGVENVGDWSGVDASITDSWANFVDHTLTTEDNHWASQTHWSDNATQCYRFENIQDIWPSIFTRPLPHENRTQLVDVGDHRMSELMNKYKEDLALWLSL